MLIVVVDVVFVEGIVVVVVVHLDQFFEEQRLGALGRRLLVEVLRGVAERVQKTFGSGLFLFPQNLDAALHVDVRA